jgi:hypothetical protein
MAHLARLAGHARRGVLLASALALPLTAVAGAEAQTAPSPRSRASASGALQVTQVEYRLALSRGSVTEGRLSLRTIDLGRDPHDLRLRASGGRAKILAPELRPGESWNGVVYLRPGSYELWCSLPEHARLGMRATLRVLR